MPRFEPPHVSLVTGASSGIGAATAIALAAAGSRVAVHCNSNIEGAQQCVQKIEAAGGSARLFQADVSQSASARGLVNEVVQVFGRIDTLVNNAGSLLGRALFLEITDELWRKALDLNLSSAFWASQEATRHMIGQGSGTIINVSSIASRNGGSPGVGAYAAAKGGLTAFTKNMARELISHGIRVNAVNPGIIETPLHTRFTPASSFAQLVSNIPQGRAGTPQEVASVIVFLASDAASYLVGETIEINGGLWMD